MSKEQDKGVALEKELIKESLTTIDILINNSINLLKQLIKTPSLSGEETRTATLIELFLQQSGVATYRKGNNVWAYNQYVDAKKPTILLNSHHDTVKPSPSYQRNPFDVDEENGKLYGLGSNDAGGCLVALIAAFLYFYNQKSSKYNLCLAATAEEEISGRNGLELIIPELKNLEFAIIGEPTLMDLAIAERGLLVLDCVAYGKAGHAAREEGENALYKALKDIEWFRTYQFAKQSELLGPIKMSVTIIEAGAQHNVVPASCKFTVDVRINEAYHPEEVLKIIRNHVSCEVTPRSVRLRPSSIDKKHPIVKAGVALGRKTFGSFTTSDQALLDIPSLKVGPGNSARSHMADEFIYLDEVRQGVELYIKLLATVNLY